MILFFGIAWIIVTVIAWRRGWKEKSLSPFAVSFVIGFADNWFEWGIFGTPLHSIISWSLFGWLIYMAIKKPKVSKSNKTQINEFLHEPTWSDKFWAALKRYFG